MSMHGSSLDKLSPFRYSTWKSIIREVHMLKDRGVDLISHCHIRVGNGLRTQFWNEVWIGDTQLRVMFPRIYALEINKDCTVADKLQFSVTSSLRRSVRGGVESSQLALLQTYIEGTLLSNMEDRWVWDLNGEGVFRVKDVRILLDECFLPKAPTATRWVKYVPIKINVFAWKVFLDRLPTRSNLQHRGVLVSDLLCPLCSSAQEDSSHLFFSCRLATDIVRLVCRWWNLSWTPLGSYADWLNWFNSIRLSSKVKDLLEGVLYITWWSVWMFRNQLLFSSKAPRKDVIFDDIVSRSFTCGRFPRKVDLWTPDKKYLRILCDLPVAEDIPIASNSVRKGMRFSNWRADKPSELYWVETQDGGDAKVEVSPRDIVYTQSVDAPQGVEPKIFFKLDHRYGAISWCDDSLALVYESWYKTRRFKKENKEGTYSSLNGSGATPERNIPFLHIFDMMTNTIVTTPVNVTGALVTHTVANHAEKPEKFSGQNFKRWQQKMFFYLTTLNLARLLNETAPQVEPPKEGQPSNAQAMKAVEA
ncbi:RNA-directed DNA polymerase, eukaryota [Tanacetum coccineum]|uniref:RNA-directed DNA polymerase, eukaryota n=1 Tax=Tanacetum coccineum TaxID=301880 RepID=A0ABQ5DIJ8_9ASTR